MVVIKIYSQDMYVASEVSINHALTVAKLLKVELTDIFFVGSEGTLVAEGVDQVSWFTYLEVSLPKSKESMQEALSELLQKIFSNYGVHIMIKYDYYPEKHLVKKLNPEFKVFNETMVEVITHENYYGDEEEDEDWE